MADRSYPSWWFDFDPMHPPKRRRRRRVRGPGRDSGPVLSFPEVVIVDGRRVFVNR